MAVKTEGAYERFVAWSDAKGVTPTVHKSPTEHGTRWVINVSIDSPVTYNSAGSGTTIDEAAAKVIEDLETVRAWEDGEPQSRFGFA